MPASADWPGFRRSMTSSRNVRSRERLPRMIGSASSGNATSNALSDIEAPELRRRHADDRDRRAVDDERCTDDAVSPSEAPLPESVADDRDRAVCPASGPIVRWRERAASNRRNAERREVARRWRRSLPRAAARRAPPGRIVRASTRKRRRRATRAVGVVPTSQSSREPRPVPGR